jgi:Ran GTPase-activating protein 1
VFVQRKADEIPMALTSLTSIFIGQNLQKLDLSNNAVGPNGSAAISPYLQAAKALQVFLISNCGLGITGVTTLSEALIDGAPNLEVLAIARNRAEDKGAQALSKALANKKNFRELHIFQNVIREPGMLALVRALKTCPSLELIDVRDNYMKNEAAKELSVLIKESNKLHSLNLSDCNMESQENVYFVEAFEVKLIFNQ